MSDSRIRADQSTSVNYDASGNPQTVRGQSAVFDAQNHLVQYGSDFFAGYNSDGLRAWKDAATPAGEQKTYYLYDHGVPLCEMDAAGNVTATNTFGLTGLAARHTSAGNTYYTWDLQGNPVQRLNESGNVTSFHAFDAFGAEMTAPYGQTNTTGDPYAGMGGAYGNYTDHETGLILMGHRYYDPSQGRFINRDPIGHAGGMDVYAYCENDPVNHSDPSGLQTDEEENQTESNCENGTGGDECIEYGAEQQLNGNNHPLIAGGRGGGGGGGFRFRFSIPFRLPSLNGAPIRWPSIKWPWSSPSGSSPVKQAPTVSVPQGVGGLGGSPANEECSISPWNEPTDEEMAAAGGGAGHGGEPGPGAFGPSDVALGLHPFLPAFRGNAKIGTDFPTPDGLWPGLTAGIEPVGERLEAK